MPGSNPVGPSSCILPPSPVIVHVIHRFAEPTLGPRLRAELRPAAGSELNGTIQSGGGNFAVPVGPLDPGVPLGDLIPPTELVYVPPDFRETALFQNSKPTVLIQTPDQPAGTENATASVNG